MTHIFTLDLILQLFVLFIFSFITAFIMRRPLAETLCIGFLILIASSNILYHIFSYNALSLTYFSLSVFSVSLITACILRYTIPWQKECTEPDTLLKTLKKTPLIVVSYIVTSAVIILYRTTYHFPRSQTQFFQTWYPDYIDASLNAGHFINLLTETQIGNGFISSAQHYALNSFGLSTVLEQVFSVGDSFISYTATTTFAVLLGFWILAQSFKKYPHLLCAFSLSVILFMSADSYTYWTLASNWSDDIFILCGAGLLYYLSTPTLPLNNRLYGAVLISCFLIFGRNYAAFYGAIISASACLYLLKQDKWKSVLPISVLFILFTVYAMPELSKMLTSHSLFYPRSSLLDIAPFTVKKFLIGTAIDWRIVSKKSIIHMSLIYLCALYPLIRYRRIYLPSSAHVFILFVPFILFALPFLLEILTGYRKHENYSKLYHIAVWLPLWYPLHVLRFYYDKDNRNIKTPLPKYVKYGYIVAAFILVLSNTKQLHKIATDRFLPPSSTIAEHMIADAMKEQLSADEYQSIIKRPIIYTHAEPGIGLRRIIGGSIFQDYDFFSDCLQNKLRKDTDLKSFLTSMNAPIIYLSRPLPLHYYQYTHYQENKAFMAELSNYKDIPYIKVIEVKGQALLIPDVKILAVTEPEKRLCRPVKLATKIIL